MIIVIVTRILTIALSQPSPLKYLKRYLTREEITPPCLATPKVQAHAIQDRALLVADQEPPKYLIHQLVESETFAKLTLYTSWTSFYLGIQLEVGA